ncbi:hypothetical protein ACSN7O_004715 [Enterobacter chuandaensis]
MHSIKNAGSTATLNFHGYISGEMDRDYLIQKIAPYGFIECGVMLEFLYHFCEKKMGISELIYILEKTKECLQQHDNHTAYFYTLKELVREVNDELIYRLSM